MISIIRADGRQVTASQDRVAFNYAFNGQNGIVKNIANQCTANTNTQNIFGVNSGELIMQGVQVTLDGTDVLSLPIATGSTVYWTTVYMELDMSASEVIGEKTVQGKATLRKIEYTNSYPSVPTSDDLRVQPNGKVYLGLYKFKQTVNGTIDVVRTATIIDVDTAIENERIAREEADIVEKNERIAGDIEIKNMINKGDWIIVNKNQKVYLEPYHEYEISMLPNYPNQVYNSSIENFYIDDSLPIFGAMTPLSGDGAYKYIVIAMDRKIQVNEFYDGIVHITDGNVKYRKIGN